MATLRLIWDHCHIYDLWSWSTGTVHKTARVVKRIKNGVCIAHIGPKGMEPTQIVVVKVARGPDEMFVLNREAEFYSNELRLLQGTVVPECYGFFKGKADGVELGCLLLEYCTGRAPVWKMEDFTRYIMLSICKIHEAGLIHGDLLDGHHIVKMGDGVRIIDFSTSVRHRCQNGIPTLMDPRAVAHAQCKELVDMERIYGFSSDMARSSGRRFERFWS